MRHAMTAAIVLAICPAFAGDALAADLALSSRIDAVTLYPDGATVTRAIDFDAPSGDTTLIATDFPINLDPASIRLDASGSPGIAVASVDSRQVLTGQSGPDAALEAKLEGLRDTKAAIGAETSALLAKKGFIERIAASTQPTGGEKAALDPGLLRAAWNAVGEDLASVNEAIRAASVRERGLDRDIARLEAERDGRPQGEQRMEIRIALASQSPAKGRILVSYIVGNAGWTPLYDARLDTSSGKLALVRRARIAQSTSEDWNDVALTVSTTRARAGAGAPKLVPLIVSYDTPRPLAPPAPASQATDGLLKEEAQRSDNLADEAPEPGREREAVLDTGGFQSSWAIPGRTTIASGPASRSIRLASLEVAPEILARTAPALATTAFIEAAFEHQDDTPLFPGHVAIYRDGLYAGQSDMPLATRGEFVRLGFGADDRIKVERTMTRRLGTETGWSRATASDLRNFKVTVRNGRPTPIKVIVEEAIPVSETGDIKVEIAQQAPPATDKNADNRRGVYVWANTIPSGEVSEIRFGYKVSWPAEMAINLD